MRINSREELRLLIIERRLLGHAAEIGVAEGRTALDLLQWGFRRVYLVDLWQHVPGGVDALGRTQEEQDIVYQQCVERLASFDDRTVFLRGWSHEMAAFVPDESLDFLFIDASHDYENVNRDLSRWYPKVRLNVGAFVCLHDYSNPKLGVKRAVDEFTASLGITQLHVLPGGCKTDATVCFEKKEG